MFRGVAHLNVDSKGRIAIPARYRESLLNEYLGQLVITAEKDPCLLIFPTDEWAVVERKLMKLPNLNSKTRSLQRLYVGHATDGELDGQGRVLIPTPLREFAGISKRVVLTGQGNKFELWDEELYLERRDGWLNELRAEDNESSDDLASFSL